METALRMPVRAAAVAAVFTAFLLAACGGSDASSGDSASETGGGAAASEGLTAEQLEKGVGPITNVELGDIVPDLVATGLEVFTIKCSACHKMDERYVGPALRDVTERRAPEFVMNMILNPEGMVAEHPEAKAMLAQFAVPMANQNLTEDEARAVLEYLRSEAAKAPGS